MLKSPSIANVFVTASWYHDEEVLPYYVQVTFYDPGYDRDNFANSGFSFLFDLRTATLIELNQLIVEDSGKALQYVRLDPKQACGSEP
jgi:hypothetical protein